MYATSVGRVTNPEVEEKMKFITHFPFSRRTLPGNVRFRCLNVRNAAEMCGTSYQRGNVPMVKLSSYD